MRISASRIAPPIAVLVVLVLAGAAILNVAAVFRDRDAVDAYGRLLEARARLRVASERRAEEARTAALVDELKQLSRGRIQDYQVREIVRVLGERCDREVTPELVIRVISRESTWNFRARGRHGEIGLGQIKPATAEKHLKPLGLSDLYDPVTNVMVTIEELKRLRTYCGSVPLALAAYNRGPNDPGVQYALAIMRELE